MDVYDSTINVISFGSIWKRTSESMRNNWGRAILALFITVLIYSGAGFIPFLNFFTGLLLFPLTVGVMLCFLRIARHEEWTMEQLFDPFNEYFRMLWGYIRLTLVVLLFYLLLIIPGIIATLAYALTYYVMLDEKELSVKECMRKSAFLMQGYKWKLFLYGFLWSCIIAVVCVLTLGIGLFFLLPFVNAFWANFYVMVRENKTPPEVREDVSAEAMEAEVVQE